MARRSAHRRWCPSAVAVATTAGLVGVLGSEELLDQTDQADPSLQPLLVALTGLPAWATTRLPSDLEWALAAKMATLLLAVAVLARVVAAAQSRMAAFMAGWGTLVLSGALAGLVFLQVGEVVSVTAGAPGGVQPGGLAAAVDALNGGAVFGLYTGWLVGLVVALTIAPSAQPTARGARRHRAASPAPDAYPAVPTRRPRPPSVSPEVPAPVSPSSVRSAPGAPPEPRRASSPRGTPTRSPTRQPTRVPEWPPRPRIGTILPNPAWMAAGLHQDPVDPPTQDASPNGR